MTRNKLRYWLLVQPFVWTLMLILIWPLGPATQGGNQGATQAGNDAAVQVVQKQTTLLLGSGQHPEILLFLIVIVGGALGSSIFAVRSYAGHQAAGDFDDNYIEWYFFRLPVGIGIALAIYVVLRGGLIAGSFANQAAATNTVNPYGFAAISVLAGMFSKRAAEKLKEIFDNIFRTEGSPTGATQTQRRPTISKLSKTSIKAKSTGENLKLTVTGQHFDKAAKVHANGNRRTTVYRKPTELQATLTAKDVAAAGSLEITVVNPKKAGGGKSEPQTVSVVA